MTDFKLFQKLFKEWQKKFGLTGYKVYFKHGLLEGCFASITVNQRDMVATIGLNSIPTSNPDGGGGSIEQSAKHEAIHLLLFKLEHMACNRWSQEEEIYEAVEELVFKLEDLIK